MPSELLGHAIPLSPNTAAKSKILEKIDHARRRSTVPGDGLALSKEDRQVLSLRNRGLWPSEIAVLLGIRVESVRWRLERLGKAGFTFPAPTGPRPIPHRKVTNDELLALAKSGFSIPEIAARLGMSMANAHRRIKRLTERG